MYNNQENVSHDRLDTIRQAVEEVYTSVVWTHKTHEKQCCIYTCLHRWLTLLNIVAGAIISAGLVSVAIWDEWWMKLTSACLAVVSTILNALAQKCDFPARIASYAQSAHRLLVMRDKFYRLLLKIKLCSEYTDDVMSDYDELIERLHSVYATIPKTTQLAYCLAGKALKGGSDNIVSQQEKEAILPHSVRKHCTK